eukprot:3736562-Prymnesium_polylepis.1
MAFGHVAADTARDAAEARRGRRIRRRRTCSSGGERTVYFVKRPVDFGSRLCANLDDEYQRIAFEGVPVV